MKKYFVIILFLILVPIISFPQIKTLTHSGVKRTYKVHLPASYDTAKKYPLVFVFNGWTHGANQTETHTKMSIKADSSGFIVVYPEGIAGSNREWNHDDRYALDDVGFIKELLDTLIKDYSVNTNMIYTSGFSNGAGMAYRMGYELPDRIAAIAGVAGILIGTNYCTRPTPAIQFYAKNDGTSYQNVPSVVAFWKGLCASVTGPDTICVVPGAKGVKWTGDNNTEFVFYLTDIGQHSWPGGNPSFATPSQAISADYLIWEFFKKHTLDGTTGVSSEDVGSKLDYKLFPNFPNPFNPETIIRYQLPEASKVEVRVFDMLGKEISELVNAEQSGGVHQIKFDAHSLSSGIYLYKLQAISIESGINFIKSSKMILIK